MLHGLKWKFFELSASPTTCVLKEMMRLRAGFKRDNLR